MAGTYSDFTLGTGQSSGFRVVAESVEESVVIGFELAHSFQVETVSHTTFPAQYRHRVDVGHFGDEEFALPEMQILLA